MKALSVRQPWASRILRGEKRIEVRSWATSYRGPLLICATHRPRLAGYPTGVALCVVELIDCRPMRREDERAAGVAFLSGAYAWVLGNVRPIAPFPISGRLGLFQVEVPSPSGQASLF
ncbi:MAG: ASCH domain-containing protein [Bacillota bacterium]